MQISMTHTMTGSKKTKKKNKFLLCNNSQCMKGCVQCLLI